LNNSVDFYLLQEILVTQFTKVLWKKKSCFEWEKYLETQTWSCTLRSSIIFAEILNGPDLNGLL